MKTISVNTKLYYLLTEADGEVHKKEVEMGEKMMWHEALNNERFQEEINQLRGFDKEEIYKQCINELIKFNKNDQVNCLAWMCLIANADGFMDKNEWQLIYKIYHKALHLELNEIMQRQKELKNFIGRYRSMPEEKKNQNGVDTGSVLSKRTSFLR